MRIGSALAAAAVVVALPRHLVAQLHQAGYPAPSGPVWPVAGKFALAMQATMESAKEVPNA